MYNHVRECYVIHLTDHGELVDDLDAVERDVDDDALLVLAARLHRQLLPLQRLLAHPVAARFRHIVHADDLRLEVDADAEALRVVSVL